ncbi:MAG: DNA alkylation repair protein [Bacteroidales bacterium]
MEQDNIIIRIQDSLFAMQDKEYAKFNSKLIPNISPQTIIGLRTPLLRKAAKEFAKMDNINQFLDALPHQYFDENQLHAFIIGEYKDFNCCIKEVEKFLPYINNWATCDQLSPRCFKKHTIELLKYIDTWLQSKEEYTVRFAIGMLLQHYLGENFNKEYLYKVCKIRTDEYYIKMMQAWYVATALAKQYENTLTVLQEKLLDVWTHNKAIQKALESYRITKEQKKYLRTLKMK